ncbi:hypothetical protein Tco_1176517 [Tanacetum coccineum]
MSCARLRSLAISNLSVTQNSRNSLTSYSAYSARSCDRVIVPLAILSDSRVTTSGGGTTSGGNGEEDLDLLRDKDGKSDGGGEDDDFKSDGGVDNDGIIDVSSGRQLDGNAALY